MSWWSAALRTESKSWIFAEVDAAGLDDVSGDELAADEVYVSVFCQAMHLEFTRTLATRYYGVLGSTCELMAGFGARSDLSVSRVVTPENLRRLDEKHLDRVVTGTSRLFGPLPYRGGDLSVELGLLAVPEEKLLEPYLGLLTAVARASGVVPDALVSSVAAGLKALLDADAQLLIGVSTTWPSPRSAAFAVVRAPASELGARGGLALADHQLLWTGSGESAPVTEPYLVFSVSASTVKHDWMDIPELARAWEELAADVRGGDFQRVQQSLGYFERTAAVSPSLLPADAARLSELARKRVHAALPGTGTGAAREREADIGDLGSLELFPAGRDH